jgi:hypothetical protein
MNFNFVNFNFVNFVDVIQVFANEYSIPGNNVLILGNVVEINCVKEIFNFINCETYFVCDTYKPGIDFVVQNSILPFEEKSFDIILNLTTFDINYYLKENGKLLNLIYSLY